MSAALIRTGKDEHQGTAELWGVLYLQEDAEGGEEGRKEEKAREYLRRVL